MGPKACYRLSPRAFAFSAIGLTIVLCLYYANYTSGINQSVSQTHEKGHENRPHHDEKLKALKRKSNAAAKGERYGTCPAVLQADADINTYDVYKDFEFQVSTMR